MSEYKAPEFIHLHTHSAYSLAEGAIPVKDMVKLCKAYNMPAVAITDSNNMFGALEFALDAQKNGIQPILGMQVALGLEGHQIDLLVQSHQGYLNACKLISKAYLETEDNADPHVSWATLEECHEGLILLTGGLKGPVAQ